MNCFIFAFWGSSCSGFFPCGIFNASFVFSIICGKIFDVVVVFSQKKEGKKAKRNVRKRSKKEKKKTQKKEAFGAVVEWFRSSTRDSKAASSNPTLPWCSVLGKDTLSLLSSIHPGVIGHLTSVGEGVRRWKERNGLRLQILCPRNSE